MKQELFELDDAISLATLRIEKMDWLMGHLLNSVTGENGAVVGLLADMIALAKGDLQNLDAITDRLRDELTTAPIMRAEHLPKVA